MIAAASSNVLRNLSSISGTLKACEKCLKSADIGRELAAKARAPDFDSVRSPQTLHIIESCVRNLLKRFARRKGLVPGNCDVRKSEEAGKIIVGNDLRGEVFRK